MNRARVGSLAVAGLSLRRWWRELVDRLASLSLLDLVLPMTAMVVLFPGGTRIHYLVVGLAAAGLVVRKVRMLPWLWFSLAGLRTADHLAHGWFLIDNHHYLLTYWCAALGLVLLSREPACVLRTNARLLLGLCFGFAAAWKFLGGEYLDGSFTGYLLLTNPRPSSVIPGLSVPTEILEINRTALEAQGALPGQVQPVPLEGFSPDVQLAAVLMSLWTIGIELLIAVAFLLPLPPRWRQMGNVGLLTFVATTYTLAPVLVFGLLLVVMGLSQTRSSDSLWRLAYVCAFLVLPPVVLLVVGEPILGVGFTGAVLVLAYLHGWGRWALIVGFIVLGLTPGLLRAEITTTLAWTPLGLGTAIVAVAVLDLLFRRRTESWLGWLSGCAFVIGGLAGGIAIKTTTAWAVAGMVGLLVIGKLQVWRRGRLRPGQHQGPQSGGSEESRDSEG